MNAMGNPITAGKGKQQWCHGSSAPNQKYAMQIKNQKGRENWEAPLTSIVLTIQAIFTV